MTKDAKKNQELRECEELFKLHLAKAKDAITKRVERRAS